MTTEERFLSGAKFYNPKAGGTSDKWYQVRTDCWGSRIYNDENDKGFPHLSASPLIVEQVVSGTAVIEIVGCPQRKIIALSDLVFIEA